MSSSSSGGGGANAMVPRDVWSMLLHGFEKNKKSIAVCQEGAEGRGGEGDDVLTYEELFREILRVKSALVSMEAKDGSTIGVMMPNDCRVMQIHFAAAALNAAVLNVNTHMTVPELEYILEDTKPCVLVAHSSFQDVVCHAVDSIAQEHGIFIPVCWVDAGERTAAVWVQREHHQQESDRYFEEEIAKVDPSAAEYREAAAVLPKEEKPYQIY